MSRRRLLERGQLVPRPRSEVFAFFADATDLERITPPSLGFRTQTKLPIRVREGVLIDYRIAVSGIPFGWRTLIEVFEPDVRFVDLQLRGPYRVWRHVHEFTDVPGGTLMHDRVEYELPFGPLGELARVLFVDRQLRAIFDFRREAIAALFAAKREPASVAPSPHSGVSNEHV